MIPKLIHIGIEQVLQSIGSNIYSNFLPKEIDLQFNTVCDRFIDAVIGKEIEKQYRSLFEDSQLTLDNLRLLKIYDTFLTLTNNVATFPGNYRNLINDRSIVNRLNCNKAIKSGEIESDVYYKNNLNIPIVYNGVQYNPNDIFLGIENVAIFTLSQRLYTGNVIELYVQQNRVVESENKSDYLNSNFTKSCWYSPVSEIYQNNLKVYKNKDFKIEGVLIEYIRKLTYLDSTSTLDWNTEFPDNCIRGLIDSTAKRLIFIVESQKYPISAQELVK